MLICYLHIFFDEVSIKLLGLKKFFCLSLGFKSPLHTSDGSPLSDLSFANSFSRAMACFLTLATVCCKVETFNVNSMLSHSVVSDFCDKSSFFFFNWIMPGASLVAQMVKNLPAMQETRVQFLGWEDPLEKRMATHTSILAWRLPWIEEPGRL